MSKPSSISSSDASTALLEEPSAPPRRRRAACAQRGKRAVIWAAALFVLASLAGEVLIDLCPLRFRFPEAAFVVEHAPKGEQSPQVVLLGSSRFGLGVDARAFTESMRKAGGDQTLSGYNASIPAGGPVTADFILDQLLAGGCRPRVAVIEISPETVNQFAPWMKFHILRQFSRLQTIETIPDSLRSGAMDRVLTSLFFPLFRHNLQLTGWGSSALAQWVTGKPVPGLERVFPDPARQRGQSNETDYFKWFKQYQIRGVLPRQLNHLLARCRENNIQPILIGIPVSSRHRRFYTPAVEAEYLKFMQLMEHRHGVVFIDLAGAFEDEYFADHHHLNARGNARFSDRLGREVARVLRGERPPATSANF